jgi:hypothetical protein
MAEVARVEPEEMAAEVEMEAMLKAARMWVQASLQA